MKLVFRNYRNKPIYSTIIFGGFTIGIMASLLIYLWIYNELSYDKCHNDYNCIYRVLSLTQQKGDIVKSASSYSPLAKSFKDEYPQIELATYISYSSETSPVQTENGRAKIEAKRCWSNEDFFKIFTGYKFIEGNPEDALSKPSNIIISEKVAHKLFGDESALGKSLISDKYGRYVYKIGGVVQVPEKSHIHFDYMLSENNSQIKYLKAMWRRSSHICTYIKLAKDAVVNEDFLTNISIQVNRYSQSSDKLLFQPLADIHLHSDYEENLHDKNISSYKYIWLFSGLALLILFMAVFNFSMLSVARASERSTEIGVKKINGADKFHFVSQFLGESIFQTTSAAVLAITLLWLLLPLFNQFTGQNIQFIFTFKLLFNLLLLVLGGGILAGIYPTFFLSSLNPNKILKKVSISGSPNKVLKTLVTVQFIIVIAFITSTTIFIKQINYIQDRDTGLDHDNMIVIPTGLWYDNVEFKDELLRNPNVLNVSASAYAPVDFGYKSSFPVKYNDMSDTLHASLFWVDQDFAKTYGLQVVKGHFLNMDFSAYWEEWNKSMKKEPKVSYPIVINETAEKALKFDDPIGKRLGNYVIVGVVKDFNFRTAYHPIEPIVLTNDPQNIMTMNIKISSYNRAETLKYISTTYKKYRDDRAFSYQFYDDMLNEKYKQEIFMRNITILFTIVAIVISVLGILGISLFSIERRIKEIGIRKVNGAKVFEVITLLSKDYVIWVIIAFVIATPMAWYAINVWLGNFAYKTELSWWIFALAGLLALGIALLTVSWQSWRAAIRNPIEALRYE